MSHRAYTTSTGQAHHHLVITSLSASLLAALSNNLLPIRLFVLTRSRMPGEPRLQSQTDPEQPFVGTETSLIPLALLRILHARVLAAACRLGDLLASQLGPINHINLQRS